jgi:cell division protein FtsW
MRSFSAAEGEAQAPSPFDRWFVAAVLAILLLGLLMMTSASIALSDKTSQQPFYFLFNQLIRLAMGVGIGCAIVQVSTETMEKNSGYLLLGVMMLLCLVLIPGIGHSVNGSYRWLGIGPLGFQVSELAKLVMVIYMAGYLVRRNGEIQQELSGFVKPMLILAATAALLLKEPDFGATVVITVTALGMMFMGGMQLRHFAALLIGAAGLLAVIAISAPYRLARLTSFMDPWKRPFDTGYQLTQSLIAFGRGGWFGSGLGKSIQKMFYLPEAHTDFLFAVIAEELGVIGMFSVIALFTLLVIRIFIIGREAQRQERHFSGYVAYGCGMWVAIQFIVSIGVNSGLLPTKGLTLPLMSYGGSSMLVNCFMIAVLLRIDYENRLLALGIQ